MLQRLQPSHPSQLQSQPGPGPVELQLGGVRCRRQASPRRGINGRDRDPSFAELDQAQGGGDGVGEQGTDRLVSGVEPGHLGRGFWCAGALERCHLLMSDVGDGGEVDVVIPDVGPRPFRYSESDPHQQAQNTTPAGDEGIVTLEVPIQKPDVLVPVVELFLAE